MQEYAYGSDAQTARASNVTLTVKSSMGNVSADRQSIIKEYEWAITDLDSALTELFDRLGPVLTGSYPAPCAGDSDPVSDARHQLYLLQELAVSVRQITGRLEV